MLPGLILSFIVISCGLKTNQRDASKIVAYGTLLFIFYLYIVTEILSSGSNLTREPLFIAWAIYDVILLAIIGHKVWNNNTVVASITSVLRYPLSHKIVWIFGAFSIFMVMLAVNIVPFNWDSISYHLPRIWFWAEHGTVAHFPTPDTRMLGTPPLKEFVDLQIYLLYGSYGDTLLNLTQCISYLLTIILVYGIAVRIGCDARARILSALLFAVTPIAFAEGLSTQTDEFTSFLAVIFVRLALDFIYDVHLLKGRCAYAKFLPLSLAAGFAVLSKPSCGFILVAFATWLVIASIRYGAKWSTVVKWSMFVVVTAVLVSMPELRRMYFTYHSFHDPYAGPGQVALSFDPRKLFINFIKNIGYLMPDVLWPQFNAICYDFVYKIAAVLHVNADAAVISEGAAHYRILSTEPNYMYDTATNSVQTSLFLIFAICFIGRKTRSFLVMESKNFIHVWHAIISWGFGYSTVAFLSFLLAASFVKNEPFMCRYMVGNFAVLAPALAYEIQRLGNIDSKMQWRGMITGAVLLMMTSQSVWMTATYYTSMYHQMGFSEYAEGYYRINPDEYRNVYIPLKKFFEQRGKTTIGLDAWPGSYVYATIQCISPYTDKIEYVNVNNSSKKYEYIFPQARPDYVVISYWTEIPKERIENYKIGDTMYPVVYQLSPQCYVLARE